MNVLYVLYVHMYVHRCVCIHKSYVCMFVRVCNYVVCVCVCAHVCVCVRACVSKIPMYYIYIRDWI